MNQADINDINKCQCGGNPHIVDCLYQHFLSYTGFTDSKELKMAYEHGCSVSEGDLKEAKRYRLLRRKVCIVPVTGLVDRWNKFELLNLPFPTEHLNDAALAFDIALDAEIDYWKD